MPAFADLGLSINIGFFCIGAVIVWIAGTRIARYADAISEKTGIGHALLGLLLLGGVTSLPELAVSVTSAASGNAALAVNNILGGVAMQVAILAIADWSIGHRALTSVVPDATVLLQGSLNVVLLSIVAVAVIVGDVAFLGIGLWSWLILGVALYALSMLAASHDKKPWRANLSREQEEWSKHAIDGDPETKQAGGLAADSLSRVIGKATAAAAAIVVGGYIVARSAEVIADETGLGSSFVGAVLVAISTSLPELSTVLSAARLGLYTMAISDILGTNLFDVALLFVVDGVASGPPVLNATGRFSAVGALLGILVTALFLAGLSERRDRTVARLGVDSLCVIVVYLGGLIILYQLR